MFRPTKEQIEQSLKLTPVQKRWLNNFLEAKRDFESERIYETTVTVIKRQGKWIQVIL
jgi:hypothetical protein